MSLINSCYSNKLKMQWRTLNQDEKPPDDHVLLEVEGKIQLLSTSDIQVDVDTTETIKMASPVIDSSPSKSKGFEVLQKPSGHLDQNKPFHDAYTSRYLVLPRKGSFNKERESCNNQAYQSWLKHKIEQELYHKRRESLNAADTMKDRSEERKQMNERAFRAWLEKKNVQIVKERQSSSAIQATMCPDLKTKSYSFEQWLKKKEEQKLEQIKLEQRRRRKRKSSPNR